MKFRGKPILADLTSLGVLRLFCNTGMTVAQPLEIGAVSIILRIRV